MCVTLPIFAFDMAIWVRNGTDDPMHSTMTYAGKAYKSIVRSEDILREHI